MGKLPGFILSVIICFKEETKDPTTRTFITSTLPNTITGLEIAMKQFVVECRTRTIEDIGHPGFQFISVSHAFIPVPV